MKLISKEETMDKDDDVEGDEGLKMISKEETRDEDDDVEGDEG